MHKDRSRYLYTFIISLFLCLLKYELILLMKKKAKEAALSLSTSLLDYGNYLHDASGGKNEVNLIIKFK